MLIIRRLKGDRSNKNDNGNVRVPIVDSSLCHKNISGKGCLDGLGSFRNKLGSLGRRARGVATLITNKLKHG